MFGGWRAACRRVLTIYSCFWKRLTWSISRVDFAKTYYPNGFDTVAKCNG